MKSVESGSGQSLHHWGVWCFSGWKQQISPLIFNNTLSYSQAQTHLASRVDDTVTDNSRVRLLYNSSSKQKTLQLECMQAYVYIDACTHTMTHKVQYWCTMFTCCKKYPLVWLVRKYGSGWPASCVSDRLSILGAFQREHSLDPIAFFTPFLSLQSSNKLKTLVIWNCIDPNNKYCLGTVVYI